MKKNKIKTPEHIGLIMDGNRRWAKERNLPTFEGHRKGYERIRETPGWFFKRGVKVVSLWGFSTENWNRSRDEVNYLMKLIKIAFEENIDDFNKKGYRLLVSGRIDELPGDLPELCYEAMNRTKTNTDGTINLCFNYGGRPEIIDAVKKMIKNKVTVDQVHEGMVRKYLYNGGLPDPDMVVRTSGEQRTSGFLLWESAYSEFFFMQKYWPDFEERDVNIILEEYSRRNRRFGGDGNSK
jgi:undecaprenyl diphosphate synthase